MPPRIGVVIPVGPEERHAQFLPECIASLRDQTRQPDEIVIIDDMAGLDDRWERETDLPVTIEKMMWRLGVAGAFNVGVAYAFAFGCDLAVMLGADDRLEPGALAALEETYEKEGGRVGWYWYDVRYSDGREDQALPCNAAAVTPSLWRMTGGFPPQSAAGAPDSVFISMMLVNMPGALIHVPTPEPVYWHRIHEGQETHVENSKGWPYDAVRNIFTATWKAPKWGRYE